MVSPRGRVLVTGARGTWVRVAGGRNGCGEPRSRRRGRSAAFYLVYSMGAGGAAFDAAIASRAFHAFTPLFGSPGPHLHGTPHDENEVFEADDEKMVKVGACSPD